MIKPRQFGIYVFSVDDEATDGRRSSYPRGPAEYQTWKPQWTDLGSSGINQIGLLEMTSNFDVLLKSVWVSAIQGPIWLKPWKLNLWDYYLGASAQ